jgi:putative SOS response-associated peptidase YedK
MCGRFALYTPPARLARYFEATLAEGPEGEHAPSWNVAPTDEVLGVREHPPPKDDPEGETRRELMTFRWGLIPWWSKDASSGSRLFNARCETVASRASFREAFRQRRIIVPADGFYEWRKTKTGARQPFFFTRADGAPLALAGLAERWRPKDAPRDVPPVRSCTIITTTAGPDMKGIHDRVPVLLDPATFDLWLDPRNDDVEQLRSLLRPLPAGTITFRPVDQRVGNVRNNDASLIEAV